MQLEMGGINPVERRLLHKLQCLLFLFEMKPTLTRKHLYGDIGERASTETCIGRLIQAEKSLHPALFPLAPFVGPTNRVEVPGEISDYMLRLLFR
jgi:hypothetical protein